MWGTGAVGEEGAVEIDGDGAVPVLDFRSVTVAVGPRCRRCSRDIDAPNCFTVSAAAA
jgi:hypothetical protein